MTHNSTVGFNVIGHVSGNLGIGVTARNLIQLLLERGHPVAVFDIDPGMGRGGHDRRYAKLSVARFEALPHFINLFVLPPATIAALRANSPGIFTADRMQVGFSMWELPVIPHAWVSGLEGLDVLVAESPFIQHAFQFGLSGVEVLYAPHPLYLPDGIRAERASFGLPDAAVLFLTSFEPHSDPMRKNPEGVVRAFLSGAGDNGEAHLVIKVNNVAAGAGKHVAVAELEALAAGHPRIHLFTESLSYTDTLGLYACCDVFVSLHRAEGLGLAPMECMALGKPVIATGWSGNLAYMDHTNACLVGYRLIPVAGTIPAYSQSMVGPAARWADPDLPQAAGWIDRLARDPALRAHLGQRAQSAMLAHHARACRAAFVDELLALHERRRGSLPAAAAAPLPPAAFRHWERQRKASSRMAARRAGGATEAEAAVQFHIVVPIGPGDHRALADTIDALAAQTHPHWRLTVLAREAAPDAGFAEVDMLRWERVPEGRDLASAFESLAAADGHGWLALLAPGDRLTADALAICARAAVEHAEWQMLYTDELLAAEDGTALPSFKPEANLELLRSESYIGRACLVRPAALAASGGISCGSGAEHYELALKIIERFGPDALGHIPDVLFQTTGRAPGGNSTTAVEEAERIALRAHLQRAGLQAEIRTGTVVGTRFVDYELDREPRVSIIIPSKDQPDYIRACLESLLGKTRYSDFEVLIVDNGTTDSDAAAVIAQAARDPRVKVLPYPAPYNFAAMNNTAADVATGEYLLLLNNDTVIVQENWLARMMAHARREEVGIVGARLVFPNQTLQHAGIVLGMGANGVAEHVNYGLPMTAPGYLNRAQVAQEVTAVTGACMLVRRSLWSELGGMDACQLAVMYNDVDLCLRARERGYRVIWTPFATLVHHGSGTLGKGRELRGEERARAERETAVMLERWLPRLARDPAYNPNLSLIAKDGAIDSELRAQWDAVGDGTRIMALTAGSSGSRAHRAAIPLEVLSREGRAATHMVPSYSDRVRVPSVAELAREAPNVLLAHNAVHEVQIEALERYRRFNRGTFLVFGQDDLMTDLPAYNEFARKQYPDIGKRLRRAMQACHRLLVSTDALADAYGKWSADIRVVPNRLDGARWSGLKSARRRGRRPRVGWAGAQQHSGDLEIIFDVVKETADEVEWVFFGLCFREWLACGVEVHDPVDFERYPAQLAALDLDLALAPLAYNRFNQAKSNLKALEYGILGIPVVCTDIEPYRGMPVHRIPNTKRAWIEAIRERIHDLDAAAGQGDLLRAWVLQHGLLEDHLDEWLAALLPEEKGAARQAMGARR